MARLSSYSAAAIRTTAAMFTISGTVAMGMAPMSAEASVDAQFDNHVKDWAVEQIDSGWSAAESDAIVVTERHNEALYDALRASQTVVSGPIFVS